MQSSVPSSSVVYRVPFATDPIDILPRQALVLNRFTKALVEKWDEFYGRAHTIRSTTRLEASGPRKRMLIISVSEYTAKDVNPLEGPKTDWKIWAMLGIMSGWSVEVVADTLPVQDPTRHPAKENIQRSAGALLEGNSEGDQFMIAYSGHCDEKGLILEDGEQISSHELWNWFVRPLKKGCFLWTFFDCCQSSNLFGLPYRLMHNETQGLKYESLKGETGIRDAEVQGTVISIGSAAGPSGELGLDDPAAPSQGLRCGPLAFAVYLFFLSGRWEGELLANFLPPLKAVLASRQGQKAQITTSTELPNPLLPMLRASS